MVCVYAPLAKISRNVSVSLRLNLEASRYTKGLQKNAFIYDIQNVWK